MNVSTSFQVNASSDNFRFTDQKVFYKLENIGNSDINC